jgi:N-Acetylglucosaminyltransferase-IV (GnT-IV) conserved region
LHLWPPLTSAAAAPYLPQDPYERLPVPDDFDNPDDVPGPRVRQQTCDVIRLLEHCQERSRYVVLIEDDFPACEGTLVALQYVVSKASAYRKHWRGIRTSFGASGIILPNLGARLSPVVEYARDNIARHPIDHIFTQWMCGNSKQQRRCSPVRENFAFRWNLFEHIGFQSSLRDTGVEVTPGCWEPYGDLLWSVDGYNELECPYDDMWPCSGKGIVSVGDRLDLLEVDKFAYHNYWIRVALEGSTLDVTLQKRTVPLLFSFDASESAASPSRPATHSLWLWSSLLSASAALLCWQATSSTAPSLGRT